MPLSFELRVQLYQIDDKKFYDKYFSNVDELIDFIVEYFAKKAEDETEERVKQNVLKKT